MHVSTSKVIHCRENVVQKNRLTTVKSHHGSGYWIN